MDLLLSRVADGITNGSIYAIVALSMVVVLKGTRHLNFAQGEFAMLSTFVVLFLTGIGAPLWLAAIGGVAFGFLLGVVADALLIRPLEKKPGQAIILVTIGLYLLVNALAGVIWGIDPQGFPRFFGDDFFAVGGLRLFSSDLMIWAVLALVAVGLWLLTEKTALGLKMRAVASNRDSAALSGIRVNRVNAMSWGIGGAVGALGGLLVATSTQISPAMLTDVLVYALAAATLGGLDSMRGAVLAGILIGVLGEMIVAYVPGGGVLRQPLILALIVVVLLVRPSGILGSQKVVRA